MNDKELAEQVKLTRDMFQAALDKAYDAGLDVVVTVSRGGAFLLRKPTIVRVSISKEL